MQNSKNETKECELLQQDSVNLLKTNKPFAFKMRRILLPVM